jgi:hypothetical protein
MIEPSKKPICVEHAGYFAFSGAHLYSVLHEVTEPIARILLVGPFASDRPFSYVPWVRWARFLAAKRVEALRFDYRGVGESTGAFEDMGFEKWSEDVEFLANWLQSRSPSVPLILHGLEMGAVLASNIFAKGTGDALLLWGAPTTANEVLRRTLSRRIAVDAFNRRSSRNSLQNYLQQLETDQSIEVEGYRWSGRLWRESFTFALVLGNAEKANPASVGGRPVRLVKLDNRVAPLINGQWSLSLNPDLSGLFDQNFDWIGQVLTVRQVGQQQ